MKRFQQITFFLLIAGFALLQSCNPDDDPTVLDLRDNYIGKWKVQESSKGKLTYEVQITADSNNSNNVFIKNFYDFGIKPYAVVTTSGINLPSQTFAKYIQVYGFGTYSSNKINWTYYVNNGADLDTIISVYTRL